MTLRSVDLRKEPVEAVLDRAERMVLDVVRADRDRVKGRTPRARRE
ncbi:hypothetical protein AB0G60_34490 [Streptomyces angustmyceticus]|nr:hypothetical protein [Streptomyces angustmyceticus]UAL70971.1 hypothetical protein K7396_34165 [Streptomyces angustmyceticus]